MESNNFSHLNDNDNIIKERGWPHLICQWMVRLMNLVLMGSLEKKKKKIIIKAGKNNIVLKITLIGQGPCVPIIIPCLKKH